MQDEKSAFLQKIEEIAERTKRYKLQAYLFVYAALEYTAQSLGRDNARTRRERHVSGQELARGIAAYAQDQFGPMARSVLDYWGIHETLDFGKIVFSLVDEEMMQKTEEDRLEDFRDVYGFDKVFDPKRIQSDLTRLNLERL